LYLNKKGRKQRVHTVSRLFAVELKRTKTEGQKCHAKTMRMRKPIKLLNKKPIMFRRTQRRKNEGRI
jgi:hypothetical protein